MPARKTIDQRMAELEAEKQTLMLRDSISKKLVDIRVSLKKRNVGQLETLSAHLNKVASVEQLEAAAAQAAAPAAQ